MAPSAPSVQDAWSPKPSASPLLATHPSPVMKSAAVASPKVHNESPVVVEPVHVSPSVPSSSLPPGLGGSSRPQILKRPKENVVIQNATSQAAQSTQVQFGSFGLAKPNSQDTSVKR